MPFMLVTESLEKEKDKFLSEIKKNSSYSFPPSSEYPLSELYEKKGMMFSLLIGESRSGEEVVLKGSSGMRIIPGYVNPCYSRNKMSEVLEKHDKLLKSANDDGEKKKREAEALSEINSLFSFSSLSGDAFTLSSIESAKGGSGTCAGVKVLNSAIRKGYRIKAFAEFFVGKENENYKEGKFHPPCNERCKEIIGKMLLLDYVYVDEYIAVVEKPAGLLSVPGRGEDKKDSVTERFRLLFPDCPVNPSCHRLDMDTSGLMVLARDRNAHSILSSDFEKRNVKKTYEALLDGMIEEKEGCIDLPMRLDVDNRPYQIVDEENGKRAVTEFKLLGYGKRNGKLYSRVLFSPLTGRTHQIRVHAAYGLGHSIIGDRLYGRRDEGERLCLHAKTLGFTHPVTGNEMSFSSPTPF